jgi:sulfate adenylyltransferase
VVAVPLARHPDPALDAELRDRVLAAYTPGGPSGGSVVLVPDHDGPLADAVAEAVRLDRPVGVHRGLVVLFTGLSGSGKSTIARGLRNALIEDGRRTVTVLDGDVVRRHLSAGLGFSRADRDTNIRRIGWVAAEIGRHGGLAIASPIAPFAATRAAVRAMVTDAGGEFVLVHVATPLAECERRDRKGLYARARAGEIADFTGISSPYEEPTDADLRIDTTGHSVDEAVDAVLAELRRRELIR